MGTEEGSTGAREFPGCSPHSDYKIISKLGEGTFGEVHKAMHKSSGRIVALKRILMHNEKEGLPITAIREIKILKMLDHENVIKLIDIAILNHSRGGSSNNSNKTPWVYMVFPYMDHDLTGLLENPKVKLAVGQIKLYMQQLLEGTAYLHSNRILHRDIKASNLLINNRGVLQIGDFGLARAFRPEEPQDLTKCVVTRWYRPPELLLGERRYAAAIDMWGVGCIFAEMLLAHPLFPGKSDLDQLDLIFKLCGSPSQSAWPGWDQLPDAGSIGSFGQCPRVLRDQFRSFGPEAAALLDSLLVLDPSLRIDSRAALEHAYFFTPPFPARLDQLPHFEPSHEYDRRRNQPAHQPNLHMLQKQMMTSSSQPSSAPSRHARSNSGSAHAKPASPPRSRANAGLQQPPVANARSDFGDNDKHPTHPRQKRQRKSPLHAAQARSPRARQHYGASQDRSVSPATSSNSRNRSPAKDHGQAPKSRSQRTHSQSYHQQRHPPPATRRSYNNAQRTAVDQRQPSYSASNMPPDPDAPQSSHSNANSSYRNQRPRQRPQHNPSLFNKSQPRRRN